MSRTRMTMVLAATILVVIWLISAINGWSGRISLTKGDFVEISGEMWMVHKAPSFTNGWLRHQMINCDGQKNTIHVIEMGRLVRNDEAKVIRKGDPKWKEIADGFAIASH